MRTGKLLLVAAALQAVTFSVALAQDSPPTTDSSEIVVHPPSASDRNVVRSYVRALTAPGERRTTLPRWNGPLCLGVTGMQAAQARVVNDRIGLVADSLGVDVQAPGCTPNVLIFFTRDPAGLMQNLSQQTNLFSASGDNGNSLGDEALREFAEAQRPVRWWHVTNSSADGFVFGRDSSASAPRQNVANSLDPSGSAALGEAAVDPAQARAREMDQQMGDSVTNGVRVRSASRISGNVQEIMARAVLIVDATQTNTVTVGALADYIAMVALAQINPNGDVSSVPSILNLFNDDGPRPDGLTSWDRAYLYGLYSANDPPSTRQHENQIVRSMTSEAR